MSITSIHPPPRITRTGTREGADAGQFAGQVAGQSTVSAGDGAFGAAVLSIGERNEDERQRIPGGHAAQPQPVGRGRGADRGRWSAGVDGHGAGRLGAALGDPAVGEAAGATPQRDGQAQVAAGQGGCLCGCPGMAERTPERVVPVLGKRAAAVALALQRAAAGQDRRRTLPSTAT